MMLSLTALLGFPHCTKRGKGSNWEGTSSGAEGDMFDKLLRKVKSEGYTVGQIIMDHDTSANVIVCTHFPDIHIIYCSNHSAKSFHHELNKIKSLSCKCKKEGRKCKHMHEIYNMKNHACLCSSGYGSYSK